MFYVIDDSYGAPQCGYERITFEAWYELEEYLDARPDVMERIEDGYAILFESEENAGGTVDAPIFINAGDPIA